MNMPQTLRMRRHYRERGYQVFRSVFPANDISAIEALARQVPAHAGKLRRQDGVFAANDFFPGTTPGAQSAAAPSSVVALRTGVAVGRTAPAGRLSLQVLIRPTGPCWGDLLSQPYDRHSLELERVSPDFSIRVMD